MKPLITIVPMDGNNGTCNCCRRGELRKDGRGLEYPYSNMVRVEGMQLVMNFCPDCWDEIKRFIGEGKEQ